MVIRKAEVREAKEIAKVEALCFPAAEAATLESITERLATFPDSFLVAEEDEEIIGFINGCVTNDRVICDEMFESADYHNLNGAYQAIFGLDVHLKWQHKGIATLLMKAMIQNAAETGRKGLILTCKEHMIPFYGKFGYCNQGISKSTHGNAVWYDMILEFDHPAK